MSDIPTKPCKFCGRDLPATTEYFTPNKGGKYGLRPDCNECRRERSKTPELRAYARDWFRIHYQDPEFRKHNSEYRRSRYQPTSPEAKHKGDLRSRGLKECGRCKEAFPATREYFAADPQRRNGIGFLCHKCNTLRVSEYQRQRPDIVKVHNRQRYDRKKSLPHAWRAADWRACCSYFEHRCVVCGKAAPLVKDHWISIQDDNCPGTIPANIVPMCRSCNSSKGDDNAYEWLAERYDHDEAVRICSKVDDYFLAVSGVPYV